MLWVGIIQIASLSVQRKKTFFSFFFLSLVIVSQFKAKTVKAGQSYMFLFWSRLSNSTCWTKHFFTNLNILKTASSWLCVAFVQVAVFTSSVLFSLLHFVFKLSQTELASNVFLINLANCILLWVWWDTLYSQYWMYPKIRKEMFSKTGQSHSLFVSLSFKSIYYVWLSIIKPGNLWLYHIFPSLQLLYALSIAEV